MQGNLKDPPTIQNKSWIQGQQVYFMADVHHVLKNVRNGMLSHKDIFLPETICEQYQLVTNKVEFSIFQQLIEFDNNHELKVSPHLDLSMVEMKGSFSKMAVAPAKKLLSQQTAASIRHWVNHGKLPQEALTTAFFCEVFGRWIAIMTCKARVLSFSNIDEEKHTEQINFLLDFMEFFGKVKFGKKHRLLKPFQKGALLSTQSILDLSDYILNETNNKFFRAGTCLGDVIEGFHRDIRAINKNPTTVTYPRYVKAICMTQALKKPSAGFNCDYDDSEFLSEFKNIKCLQNQLQDDDSNEPEFIVNQYEKVDDSQEAVLAYLTGYIIKNLKCELCRDSYILIKKPGDEEIPQNSLIGLKEFTDGSLTRPTLLCISIFQEAEALFVTNRENFDGCDDFANKLSIPIFEHLSEKFDLPNCHLLTIIKRFVRYRHMKGTMHENISSSTANRADIEGASCASRSTRSMTAQQLQ